MIFRNKTFILENVSLSRLDGLGAEPLGNDGQPLAVMVDLSMLARKGLRVLVQEVVDRGERIAQGVFAGPGVFPSVHYFDAFLPLYRKNQVSQEVWPVRFM